MKFIDCNNPGIIYIGSEAHMEGLRREGGCPQAVSWTFQGDDELWRYNIAPDFWAQPEPCEAQFDDSDSDSEIDFYCAQSC